MEHCFQRPAPQTESNHEDTDKLKATSAGLTGPDNNSGGFDCNICLDLVQDPIVTFCGHLYCWPCIYRWLQSQKTSSEDPDQQSQCPVCKAKVSQNTLIPLYGRGQFDKPSDSKSAQIGLVIPQRPSRPGFWVHTHLSASSTSSSLHPHPSHQLRDQGGYPYYSLGDYSPSPVFGFAGTTTYHPMIGMFGEMIHARFFGNSQASGFTHPNSVGNATSSGRGRVTRHVMRAERSLSRFSFFLLCCVIMCLLLF